MSGNVSECPEMSRNVRFFDFSPSLLPRNWIGSWGFGFEWVIMVFPRWYCLAPATKKKRSPLSMCALGEGFGRNFEKSGDFLDFFGVSCGESGDLWSPAK